LNFNPNSNTRALFRVEVTSPPVARLVVPLGLLKLGVFVKLKTCARKSTLFDSVMRKFLIHRHIELHRAVAIEEIAARFAVGEVGRQDERIGLSGEQGAAGGIRRWAIPAP
jgi:hypothetical protein